jgi:phosphoribosyl 1,2-cyclic phosphodiesterase
MNEHVYVAPLASGSSGNALLISVGERSLLVDAGISLATVQGRARSLGLRLTSLDAVVCTHWHADHAGHAARLCVEYACPLIASRTTLNSLEPRPPRSIPAAAAWMDLPEESPFEILPIEIQHEEGSRAFAIQAGSKLIVVAQDLGHPPEPLLSVCHDADVLCVEANYDPEMLANGTSEKYTAEMRARIASDDRGHLGNAQAAAVIGHCSARKLQSVIALHISSSNNTPALVETAMKEALQGYHARLYLAAQDKPLLVEVNGRPEGVAEIVTDDSARAHSINHQVDKLIAEDVAAQESARRRRTCLGKLFGEMRLLYADNDGAALGLRDRDGNPLLSFTSWMLYKADMLSISKRTADYYLDVAELLKYVPQEEVEQMPIVAADALALYSKTKHQAPPGDMVREAKRSGSGEETKRRVFKELFPGKTGHFEGPDEYLSIVAGRKTVLQIRHQLDQIRSINSSLGETDENENSDAGIIEAALALYVNDRLEQQQAHAAYNRTRPEGIIEMGAGA